MTMSTSLRFALRQLWKFRAANAVIITTLAMTSGMLLAVLAIANNLLISPWTYDTDKLGVLQHRTADSEQLSYTFSANEFRAIRNSLLFEHVSAGSGAPAVINGSDGLPSQVRLVRTVPAALAVTDAAPLMGRFLENGDVGASSSRIVISHALWRSHFNARKDVLGRAINLNGVSHEVVGVMPERFHYLGGDVWMATTSHIDTDQSPDRQYVVNFKLRSAGDMDEALSQLAQLAVELSEQGSDERYPPGWTIVGEKVIDAVMGPVKPALLLVLGAATLLLCIGVINVVTLLAARHMATEKEATLRIALGAPNSSLASLAFIQNLILCLIGTALGWLLGARLFGSLVSLISVEWVPRELDGHFRYVGASIGWIPALAIVIALALTAAQMIRLSYVDAGRLVRDGLHNGERRGLATVRRLLVGAQVAAAASIGVIAIAIGASSDQLEAQSPGFEVAQVLATRVTPGAERYSDAVSRHRYYERLTEHLANQPEVEAVSIIDTAPFQRSVRSATVSSMADGNDVDIAVDYHSVYRDLAGTLRPKLIEGRLFADSDRGDTLPVVVVSRMMAERLNQRGSVIGQVLQVHGQSGEPADRTIVGVVSDMRHDSPIANPRPTVYVPYFQDTATPDGFPPRSMELLVRLRDGTGVSSGFVQRAVASVDPMVPTLNVAFLEDRGRGAMAGVTLAERIFSMFALIATGLAVLGCHVALRIALQVRMREFAIRSSLGASPAHLFGRVLVEALAISAIGASFGAAFGLVGVRMVNSQLQGMAATSLTQVVLVVLSLTAFGVIASLWTANRAASTQPLEVLRSP